MDSLVSVEAVTKKFGSVTAIDNLELCIAPGTVFGLLGPNGAGKSTLLRILTGLIKPSKGTVKLFDRFRPQDWAVREKLGYMPQQPAVYPGLTVWENLIFFGKIYGMKGNAANKKAASLLDILELGDKKDALVRHLSGGMVRRVLLGTAVIHSPRFLILDEPTAGVDPVLRLKFWDWIAGWCAEGVSTLVTTHHIGEATHCHRVAFLRSGKKVEEDTPQALFEKYHCADLETAFVRATGDKAESP